MIRNLHDPVYQAAFAAQAGANIMAAPYIQHNIETAIAHLHNRFPKMFQPPQIRPTFNLLGCKSSVEITAIMYAYNMDVETLFELCEPTSISIYPTLEYQGRYLYNLPGVTSTVTLYAKVSKKDIVTLRSLGHITTVAGSFYHSVTCEA